MNLMTTAAAAQAAGPFRAPADEAACIITAAEHVLAGLERGIQIETRILRQAMQEAFGGSDAEGFWTWKDAYEACEAAQALFIKKYGRAMQASAKTPEALLAMISRIAGLLPTHTRRSEESQTRQQFSTPAPLAYVAAVAAGITPDDVVLEPSAGTGLLAAFAEIMGARLALNEIAETRIALLKRLFPDTLISQHDAASINDRLADEIAPSVIIMNPPFSAAVNVKGRVADADFRHVRSALARLPEGGRLVTITGHNFPYEHLNGAVRFSCVIDGTVYVKHGTNFETRLTVIDKAADSGGSPIMPKAQTADELLARVIEHVPPRMAIADKVCLGATAMPAIVRKIAPIATKPQITAHSSAPEAVELAYVPVKWKPIEGADLTDALYEGYSLQSIRIPDAQPHPTKLVQSAAMSSVAPPHPSYRPQLPARIIESGVLSDAQLESVIYAGDAHGKHLAGSWVLDETFDNLSAAAEDVENAPGSRPGQAVKFRRGWFLGDGTGCGKGRQVAAIILDNWIKGHRKALWISKSDKLIEDAQRDWSALGQEKLLVQPLSRFKQGTPIKLNEGILFCTYATLRSAEREGKVSRLQQVLDWLGTDFDGAIIFDEAHAMANAAGGKGERGDVAASQQGRAGLRLQRALPDARIVYVSATGATDVRNLAYAERLGLWGGEDFPFANRSEFVQAVEAGGVAAMEVMSRDMKALGLYTARSLSYDGVEVEIVEHALTPEQAAIYDAYAGAYQVIHTHLNEALEATNVTGPTGTLNGQAKSAAKSAFEGSKQRFFSALITGMKVVTLIKSVERDIADGHAPIIQLVSTGEAVMERKLADIPAEEWNDISIDLSPREVIGSYLQHAFPTQLYETYSDDEGNLHSRPAFDTQGNPIQCKEALAARDRMIEQLATLDPVPGALDQIIQHFGADKVAEVTGRSKRIVRKDDGRLAVENRPPSANLSETQAFMDDEKSILIFSDAGGTGRSYHADRGAKNQRLRVHYLLEAGWKADAAIQGLGRSNRTNQAQPPLFRPIATNVKAEKRFLSTIARRLDTLGAITRGQRQTGGQGMFRAEDNLEGDQARAALRQFYMLLVQGGIQGCSLQRFEEATGLSLTFEGGTLKEELPPITTFLNRLLALPIAMQNDLFAAFEELLNTRIEAAIAAGVHDAGMETIRAESLIVTGRRTVWTHDSGAETRLFTIQRKTRNRPMSVADALAIRDGKLLLNERSGRAAVKTSATSLMLDDGSMQRRFRLVRPMQRDTMSVEDFAASHWKEAEEVQFAEVWNAELASIPEFSTSTFYLVTGLLLPIWRSLPENNPRVYRLQTDDGERVIGRMLSQIDMEAVCRNIGIDAPKLSAADAWGLVTDGKVTAHLADGLSLRRSRVMNEYRIELTGFTSGLVEALKARGLFSEIINWKLRLFVPVGDIGAAIFTSLTDRWPLTQIAERG